VTIDALLRSASLNDRSHFRSSVEDLDRAVERSRRIVIAELTNLVRGGLAHSLTLADERGHEYVCNVPSDAVPRIEGRSSEVSVRLRDA
jgi:hypothetical protein